MLSSSSAGGLVSVQLLQNVRTRYSKAKCVATEVSQLPMVDAHGEMLAKCGQLWQRVANYYTCVKKHVHTHNNTLQNVEDVWPF